MVAETILGIDPGTRFCGLAIVKRMRQGFLVLNVRVINGTKLSVTDRYNRILEELIVKTTSGGIDCIAVENQEHVYTGQQRRGQVNDRNLGVLRVPAFAQALAYQSATTFLEIETDEVKIAVGAPGKDKNAVIRMVGLLPGAEAAFKGIPRGQWEHGAHAVAVAVAAARRPV